MTSNSRKKASNQLHLGKHKGQEIIADFSGGRITSDAGIILIAELDKKLKISQQFADCFQDYRNLSYIDYSVKQLVTQRIYALVLGYYVIAMATNSQLKLRASQTIVKAKNEYSSSLSPIVELMDSFFEKNEDLEEIRKLVPTSTWYRSLTYQTEKSWSRQRRVVTKVCYGSEGLKIRHVVTSLPAAKIPPSKLYTDKYCPRGEMENRLKEQQLDLFADRTSTQTFHSNQLRLWFSSIAYVLMQAFRHHCLSKTSFSQATVGTIRLNFLKLGARITVSVRRILIAITSACPYQDILSIANNRIQAIPDPG